ncbi:MAG: hypothetical protein SF052_06595 [Bacteroidia bacterium]|nr:hypothetical protein [Bacteroidia bacterium]
MCCNCMIGLGNWKVNYKLPQRAAMSKYAVIFGGVIFFLLTGLLTGCKCDDPTNPECPNYCGDETNPECPNYNPCWDQLPISADFRIIESASYAFVSILDTVYFDTLRTRDLIFDAKYPEEGRKFTWYVGSEQYETAQLYLDFRTAPTEVPIPITLVLETAPHPSCFPDSEGKDTLTRSIVLTNRSRFDFRHAPIHYHGYLNGNINDTITLKFYQIDYPGLPSESFYLNFKRGCVITSLGDRALTTRIRRFDASGTADCDGPKGEIRLDPDKTGDFRKVKITYSLWDRSAPGFTVRIPMLFEGRQL